MKYWITPHPHRVVLIPSCCLGRTEERIMFSCDKILGFEMASKRTTKNEVQLFWDLIKSFSFGFNFDSIDNQWKKVKFWEEEDEIKPTFFITQGRLRKRNISRPIDRNEGLLSFWKDGDISLVLQNPTTTLLSTDSTAQGLWVIKTRPEPYLLKSEWVKPFSVRY